MPNGWIILDKPLGLGSTAGVSAVKRALREGGYPKLKVGHGGTLDPLATGVLPIAMGEATKLAGRMLDSDKCYDFTIAFGEETDSLDLEGTLIATSDVRPTMEAIRAILPTFTGAIAQVPPAFSALKVDGKRAYDLARAGESVDLESRQVTIRALSIRRPCEGATVGEVTLTAQVSKGTYIRSLARDIAHALGTVGHVTMLRRTKAGPFRLDQAISLDILMEKAKARALEDVTLPIRTALDDIPALALTPEQARLLHNGQVLTGIAAQGGLHLALNGETPLALVEVLDGNVRTVRRFNL
ncbi:tRNA pseudouridine(55) synthase TruB [Aquisediminimonas profunda]|uniref:tRNA pseudouridine(55) synthase TruB n=1 Tax=Aquisediminimonas profunda TaxID=1550733 RepID=UPI001C62FFC2|nr:tRNA pseudouridine(55) synthase TruB [Aquisediminimonas profunda]